jgi:hypothetical protein
MASKFELDRRIGLANYRRSVLLIDQPGTFAYRGVERPYEHILPRERFEENILPSIRKAFWEHFATQNFSLHKYFHHLNSSQALCFNLFFPLLQSEHGLKTLTALVGAADSTFEAATFEFIPDESERTSVDFMLSLNTGVRVLFEIKYTEADFGKAKDDAKHHTKFDEVYLPRFDDRFLSAYKQREIFFRHYQIMRNILHLRVDRGDQMVFLVPRGNDALAKHLPAIHACLSDRVLPNVHVLFLEDVLDTLEQSLSGTEVAMTLREFRQKYL